MPTNFNYIQNIPFATNNPSVDQPNMLTNTNSINSIIAVDHITFGAATGIESDGWHKVIHFKRQSGDPVAIGTVGQLYTKQVTVGANQDEAIFFESGGGRITQLTGIVAGAGSQTLAATDGYTPLSGGIILQWGQVTPLAATATVVFPVAFATNNFNVVATLGPTAPPTGNAQTISVFNKTLTGFDYNYSGGAAYNRFHWIAIGN